MITALSVGSNNKSQTETLFKDFLLGFKIPYSEPSRSWFEATYTVQKNGQYLTL